MGKLPEERSKAEPGAADPEAFNRETPDPETLDPETLDQDPPDQDPPYQETVVISRKEMGVTPEAPPGEDPRETAAYQATIALSPEGPGGETTGPDEIPDSDFQETVFLAREEMGVQGDFDYENDPTVRNPESPGAEADYQETVALTPEDRGMDGPRSAGEAEDYAATMALSPEEMGVRREAGADDFSATETERAFFRRLVAKDHGDRKYRSLGKLVSGGMGAILRVLDQDLQRTSAMKVVLPACKEKEDALTGFIAEAKITGLLEHPNVIPVHELGLTEEEGLYFTMKLARGEALNEILARLRSGDPETVRTYTIYPLLSIFRKVCDALSYAHARNIIHQDIKPHNIMVGNYGEVLLMDWGLARYIGDPDQETDPGRRDLIKEFLGILKSEEEVIKGSPVYMAPEQAMGEGAGLDKQTDIFLLGATLYHMFTLVPPYFGETIEAVFEKVRNVDLIPPDVRRPDRQIPAEVCRIILKAMAPDKADRYETVEAMAADIDDLIAGKWSRQEKKRFGAGEMLMAEGEAGEEAYLILSGRVQVIKGTGEGAIVLSTLGPGDIVGEMSLIAQVTRSAGVKALEETEAAVLTQHLVSQNLRKLPPYMEKIVSTLTDRLRIANENIHPYATADPSAVVLKQLRLLLRFRAGENREAVSAPFPEMVTEIAHDLGLSARRVAAILTRAGEEGTIRLSDNTIALAEHDPG